MCDVCLLGTPCLDTSKSSTVSFGRASPLSTYHRDVVGRVAVQHLKRLWLETWKSSCQHSEDMLKPAETKGPAPEPPALKSWFDDKGEPQKKTMVLERHTHMRVCIGGWYLVATTASPRVPSAKSVRCQRPLIVWDRAHNDV